jgi:hypothetical protein
MHRRAAVFLNTARGIALVAVLLALLATVTLNFESRRNCRDIQMQNERIYNAQDAAIRKAQSGALDKNYQRVYGDDWREVKQQQITDAKAVRDQFKPRECYLPAFRTFH